MVAILAAYAVALALAHPAIAGEPRFVVIVAKGNPNVDMDATVIADIFLGRSASFPDGRYVEPIDCANGVARTTFLETVVGTNGARFRSHWSRLVFTGRARPPVHLSDCDEMVRAVARNPNAIGFIDPVLVDDGVRVVRIAK